MVKSGKQQKARVAKREPVTASPIGQIVNISTEECDAIKTRTFTIIIILLAIVLLPGLVAGCGGDDGGEETPPSAPAVAKTEKASAEFVLTNLRAVRSSLGENSFEVNVNIQNVGGAAGTYEIVPRVDGKEVDSYRVTLEAGEMASVPLVMAATKLALLELEAEYGGRSAEGEKHVVSVGSLSATVTFGGEKEDSGVQSPTPATSQPIAAQSPERWADFISDIGSSSAPFYVVGNATIYFSFEGDGQYVSVTLPKQVWPQSVAPENIPAAHMSKLNGNTIVGIKLVAPEKEYGYDVTFGYDRPPTAVVGTGDIRAGEYRPIGSPPVPASALGTARIYSALPPTTTTPKATTAPSPITTPPPAAQPAKGLPDLIVDDVWLAGMGRTGFNSICGKPSKNTGGKFIRIPNSLMDGNSYEEFEIWYSVKNIGAEPVPAGYHGILNVTTSVLVDGVYKSQSAAYALDDKTSLDPGQTTTNTVSVSLRFWDFTPGAHTITLKTNTEILTDGSAKNTAQESNYDNNEAVLAFTKADCQ